MIFSIKWRWILYNQFNSWSFLNQRILAFTNFTCYDSIVLKLDNILLLVPFIFNDTHILNLFFKFLIGIYNLQNYNKLIFFLNHVTVFFLSSLNVLYVYISISILERIIKLHARTSGLFLLINPGNWLTFINAFIIANETRF